jgi:hypothetical protein
VPAKDRLNAKSAESVPKQRPSYRGAKQEINDARGKEWVRHSDNWLLPREEETFLKQGNCQGSRQEAGPLEGERRPCPRLKIFSQPKPQCSGS